jgi:hypothetical protein
VVTDVFISYSNKDRSFVDRLAKDLEAAGIAVFFDQRITPGDSWAQSLAHAIEGAKFVLVVLTPESVASEWVTQEARIGLAREAEGKAKVIPLMLRPCTPPPFLSDKTYASFDHDYDVGLNRLLSVLKGTPPSDSTQPVPGEVAHPAGAAELARSIAEVRESVSSFKAVAPPRPITRESSAAQRDRRRCFIVMPFGDQDLQVVYEDFVKPVVIDGCNLECERGDDVFGSNVIMDDIRTSIANADVVVADLTGKNANVFYEVGICHTLDKPVLLLAQSMDDVPFDLRHRRVLLYEYSPRGCKRLEKTLREHLLAMLEKLP